MGVDAGGISGREEGEVNEDVAEEDGVGDSDDDDDEDGDDDNLAEEERRGGESSDSKASIRACSSASAASSRDRGGAGTALGARGRSCRVESGSRRS